MEQLELETIDDDAEFVIRAASLKIIYDIGHALNSGYSPEPKETFVWGKFLHEVIRRAEKLE